MWGLKLNRKVAGIFGIILGSVILNGILLNQYWRIASLEASNSELLMKLENATLELESLQKNFTDSQNYINAYLKPQIVTRLGMKLIDIKSGRYGDNLLWVTGKIQNMNNVTAYNVQLLFRLCTDNGTQVKQLVFGTLQPFEVISIRRNVWSEIGTIESWDLEPFATYEP
jgi:hypothetical protein